MRSIRKLKRLLKHQPEDGALWSELGDALLNKKKLDEAKEALYRALELRPEHASTCVEIGASLQKLGSLGGAIRAFQMACHIDDDCAEAYHLLGGALLENHEITSGLHALERASLLDPRPRYHIVYGERLFEQEHFNEALDQAKRALRLEPNEIGAWVLLGRSAYKLGYYHVALAPLKAAFDHFSDDHEILLEYAVSLGNVKDKNLAFKLLRMVEDATKPSATLFSQLARAYFELEEEGPALRLLEHALRLNPAHVEAHISLGLIHQKRGELERAILMLKRALERQPDHVEALVHLARVYQRAEKSDEALSCLARASSLRPSDHKIKDELNKLLRQVGEEQVRRSGEFVKVQGSSERVAMSGTLESFSLPDLMDFIKVNQRTGTLIISSEADEESSIGFVDGRIVSASSPDTPDIVDVLINKDLVSGKAEPSVVIHRDLVLSKKACASRSLLENGQIEKAQLEGILAEQIKAALTTPIQWTRGRFAFHTGCDYCKAPCNNHISYGVDAVLLDVFRQLDEDGR